ncbi:hypothetical protein DFH08DRAFT_812761 [Mycena albidolilacea]|uniref:Uncharacterized protein n=1 Tax=Mycena albidolilacea TaxID=1033008 RepID=A0AAD6ZSX5_9AGAR|nr:hypothetical protein DFH08DRAFT_812761 [Mycena albidolilacea]
MALFHIAYGPCWLRVPQFRESGHTGSLQRRAGTVERGQKMWGCRQKAACIAQGPCQPHTQQQFIGSTASPLQRGDGEHGATRWERTGAQAQGVWGPFAQPPLPLGQALAPLQAGFGSRARALRRGNCDRVGQRRVVQQEGGRRGTSRGGVCSNTGAEGPWRSYGTCPGPARALLPVRAGIFASAAHNFFQTGDTPERQPTSERKKEAMGIEDPVVVPAQHGMRAFLDVIGKDLVKNEAPGECTLKW